MSLSEFTVKEFLAQLSSDSPAPGGGSVAALSGALGAGLVSMVAKLTIGKEKYRESWAEMTRVRDRSKVLSSRFLELMQDDTDAFNTFMEALKLPKETVEEKEIRKEMLQQATRRAISVPLETLEAAVELGHLAAAVLREGNPNAASDAGTAALLARACGEAAARNIQINLPGVNDESYVLEVTKKMEELLLEVKEEADQTGSELDSILVSHQGN